MTEARGGAWDAPLERAPFAFLDLETTGTDCERDRICEIAVLRVENNKVCERLVSLVQPGIPVGASQAIHGIDDAQLASAPALASLSNRIASILEGAVCVGHGFDRDLAFLRAANARGELHPPPELALDTLALARRAVHAERYALAALCAKHALALPCHRAEPDAIATAALLALTASSLRAPNARALWEAQRDVVAFREDVLAVLERGMAEQRSVRIAYRVPGRPPFEDELSIRALGPSHVEGRLRVKNALRILRGDRMLWADL